MHRLILSLLLFMLSAAALSQSNDMILLQKKGRTVAHIFTGQNARFFTTEKIYVEGWVDSLKRDSIFMTHFDMRMMPTAFGTYAYDTAGRYPMCFSIKNIGYFPAKPRRTNTGLSTLLKAGGAGYLGLNTVNTLREKNALFGRNNLPHVTGALSALATGWLLGLTRSDLWKLGKKYKLKYLGSTGQ